MKIIKKYETEKEGQLEFLNDYLKLVDKNLSVNDILSDYTDGIINGNILEFKLNINYTSTVLMQVIKYLSALRIKGKSIPKNILLISLNEGNGETVASYKLKDLVFTEKENKIVLLWNRILAQAKKTENYNSKFTYGLYQIDEELNTNFKNEKEETIYKYPELNGDIKIIKYLLKEYYLTEIAPTLFIYEFLK